MACPYATTPEWAAITCKAPSADCAPTRPHAHRDHRHVALDAHLLLGCVQLGNRQQALLVRGQVGLFAEQMAQVIGEQQIVGQQAIELRHVGIHHGQAQPFFRVQHLCLIQLVHVFLVGLCACCASGKRAMLTRNFAFYYPPDGL